MNTDTEPSQLGGPAGSHVDLAGVFNAGEADLAQRAALGRSEGLGTDLTDVNQVEYRQLRLERVVLVGLNGPGVSPADQERSFTELAELAQTAGSEVLARLSQTRDHPEPATFLGTGKVAELAALVAEVGADTVVVDGELTPAQLRNLEDKVKVKVVDRTAVILDIFAQHAKTHEGQAQVELAQLLYLRQRLRGWGESLSRQVGGRAAGGAGIGGRGPGETKIETDRRRIGGRMVKLRAQLRRLAATRAVARQERRRHQVPGVAIIGYTNAGKSSLLNALTQSQALVDDSLFATLDPTTRRTQTASGRVYTLTDTVGFIRRLPTDLIEAFQSTLEEVSSADLLVHVVDAADPDPIGQIESVRATLAQIGAAGIPELMVFNKIDLVDDLTWATLRSQFPSSCPISATNGLGLPDLQAAIEEQLPINTVTVDVLLPYDRGDLLDRVHSDGEGVEIEYTGEGVHLSARVGPALAAALNAYTVSDV
ncbi:MAG: GTPase HflX [Propionibacteriaceae bacterium]|jgi:GTP-binding protein HflX|nr:GTPase HflX [Propionibacteriaceae bacterium]